MRWTPRRGADRIELCARLDVGGATPDPALIGRCAVRGLSHPTGEKSARPWHRQMGC